MIHQLWAYVVVVILVAFEGEATILLAAGAASTGYLNPVAVLGAVTLGNVISDVAWYALGHYSSVEWLARRFRWLGVTSEAVHTALGIVRRDAVKLLIYSKITNWITIPALIAVGMAKVPWKRWFPLVVASNFLIGAAVMSLGYFLASSLSQVQGVLRYFGIAATALLLLAGLRYLRQLGLSKNIFDALAPAGKEE